MTRSHRVGQLFELTDATFGDMRDSVVRNNDRYQKARLESLGQAIEEQWGRVWNSDPESNKKAALAYLEQRVRGTG